MKQFVSLICTFCIMVSAYCQTSALPITTDKTISLVFPFPILHVDRGTKDILAQQVREADNILLVKAASSEFPESNLSVITNDGSIYSFVVNYEENPGVLIYNLPINKKASISGYAKGILDNPPIQIGMSAKKWGMISKIAGIYIKDDVIYFQLKLDNLSPIDYTFDVLRFYIKDKKKQKRTAVQEIELKPLYSIGSTKEVKAHSRAMIVVAFDKFTIPDAKYMGVQMLEKNGGRNLLIKVNNRKIIKAKILPDWH